VDRRAFLKGVLALIGGTMTEQRFLGHKDITTEARRLQAMFGTLYAGGGVVKLSADGMHILVDVTLDDLRSYKFVNSAGDVISRLAAYYNAGADNNTVRLEAYPMASCGSYTWVGAKSPADEEAQVTIDANQDDAHYATIVLDVWTDGTPTISFGVDAVTRLIINTSGLIVDGTISGSTAIGARVERTSDLAIGNASWTAVTWDTERVDTDGIWAAGTPTRFTPQHAGYYTVEGCINFLSNATGLRGIAVRLNGTTVVRMQQLAAINGADTALAVTAGGHLFNGSTDYAEIMCYQNSGGNLNLNYIAANWEFIQASITRQA